MNKMHVDVAGGITILSNGSKVYWLEGQVLEGEPMIHESPDGSTREIHQGSREWQEAIEIQTDGPIGVLDQAEIKELNEIFG